MKTYRKRKKERKLKKKKNLKLFGSNNHITINRTNSLESIDPLIISRSIELIR
jgi:hypothetical protein